MFDTRLKQPFERSVGSRTLLRVTSRWPYRLFRGRHAAKVNPGDISRTYFIKWHPSR